MNSVPIHFQDLTPGRKGLIDLPIYPWNYDTKYWSESRLSQEWRLRKFAHHDILGSPVVESNTFEPSWRNLLRLDEVPWIREHIIGHDIVFPGAGYVSMAGEAIRQLTGCSDYSVRHVNFNQALVLHESKATETITNFRHSRLTDSLDSSWYDFSISSYTGSTWIRHCTGQARGGSEITPRSASIDPLPREVSSNRWYKTMKSFGLLQIHSLL
jgi:acyl transferase domain-containing protein